MNILIPHTWLLEYLETDATPEEIQKYLSLCGPSIERIYEREGEPVYDIEVTTNRVDSMSVKGIAREAAVILKQFGKEGELREGKKRKKEKSVEAETGMLPLPTIIDDHKLSKRILCVVIRDVERTPTPGWMAKRLQQVEMNVHDAVIDITNYITHELGHPCHAFDYDRIMELGGMIIVKEAEKGKKFVTLDGKEYTTVGGEIVYENDKGEIIDLPAIMGNLNTSINKSTKNVLFWLENLDAKKVRFASMTHAIRTTAAQLSEKNVDPELGTAVFEKGIELFQNLTHGKIASEKYDHYYEKPKPVTVNVPLQRITEYLGVELKIATIGQILEDLGCEIRLKKAVLSVTPPSYRPDIQIPADVIEEIARIYGYHNLPSVLMPTAIPLNKPTHTNFMIENRIKRFLADIGWQELFTYSMVSAEIAAKSGFSVDENLKIQNPLTDDRVYIRRSLLPSLEEIITQNNDNRTLSVFEVANTYDPVAGNLPNEVLHLSLVSTKKYREVKGDLEALFSRLFIKNYSINLLNTISPIFQQHAEIMVGKKVIGKIGVLPNGHVAIDVVVPELIEVVKTHPKYQPISRTSEIIEDLTFTLPMQTLVGPVITDLLAVSALISSVQLKDVYGQNVTFRFIYNDPKRNISVEEIEPIRKDVVEKVAQAWEGKLVGKLHDQN